MTYPMPATIPSPIPSGYMGLLLPIVSSNQLHLVPGMYASTDTTTIIVHLWTMAPLTTPEDLEVGCLFLFPDPASTDPLTLPPALTMATLKLTEERPLFTIQVAGCPVRGLINSGADVTVIAKKHWSPHLPVTETSAVYGIGGFTTAFESVHQLTFQSEGKTVTLKPLVMHIPVTLWGRDLLSRLGATISTHLS